MLTNSNPQRNESRRDSNMQDRSSTRITVKFEANGLDASQESQSPSRPRRSRKVKRTKSFGIMHHRIKKPQEAPLVSESSQEPNTRTLTHEEKQDPPPAIIEEEKAPHED